MRVMSFHEGWFCIMKSGLCLLSPKLGETQRGCVSRMNVVLSRNTNGAVHDGNIDLILPVPVRAGTENVV